MTVLSDLFALGIVFCVLVFLHEAGHFFTAKAFGIRVYTFSFGLGWRILGLQRVDGRWRFSIGPLRRKPAPGDDSVGTDYRISAIPFGGYVTLQGEQLSEAVTGDSREFRSRPRWQQLVVYVAGVALNIVLAFVLATALIWRQGVVFERPTEPPIVEKVEPGSSAEQAGLRPGDRLIAVEGRDARDEMTYFDELIYSPGSARTLLVERSGERRSIQVTVGSDPKYRLGVPGFTLASSEPIISRRSGMPAESAGSSGDRIVRVGRLTSDSAQVQAIAEASAGARCRWSCLQTRMDRGGVGDRED
jgi:regulator of sigma E protease